jgi:type IV pilus assembly protein PilM
MAMLLQNVWRQIWREPPPGLACEFSAAGVAVARWTPGSPRPERFASRPLPVDTLRPQPVRENMAEGSAVTDAVAEALEDAQSVNPGKRRREIAVLLPDLSARVTLLTFEEMPDKREEALSLIKFRLKKTVPFDVDEASIAYHASGKDVLVAVTPRSIVRQYEAIFENLGYLPGQVTVSTLAGINLVVDSGDPEAGSMLLRNSGSSMTIALTNRGRLRMMRTAESGDASGDLFHDIYSSAVFYQDTYGAKVDRIYHLGFDSAGFDSASAESLWAQVEADLGVTPKPLVIPGAPDESQSAYLGIFGLLAEQARQA